jgi:hypothetical protein
MFAADLAKIMAGQDGSYPAFIERTGLVCVGAAGRGPSYSFEAGAHP